MESQPVTREVNSLAFRAVLVDDEYWALDFIKNIFPWEAYGFSVEASFTDAVKALEYIVSHTVDLVMTDIRMPGFSGLDLLKEYRRKGGDAECVIISGYSEFEYARSALQEGAFDYCLKPIKRQEAEAVLARVRGACQRRSEIRNRALMELLEERDGCRKVFDAQSIALTGSMMLCAISTEGELHLGRMETASAIQSVIIPMGRQHWAYLFCGETEELESLCALIERMTMEPTGPRVGVGRIVPLEQATPNWLHEADIAAHCTFIDPDRRFERFDNRTAPGVGTAVHAFSLAVGSRDAQLVQQTTKEANTLLIREGLSLYHAQSMYNRMVTVAEDALGESAALEICGYEYLVETYASAEQMFQELAQNVISLMKSASAAPDEADSFLQLLEYVREHYGEKLSIKLLADRFYMNPTYLCELFRRKTGHTFNEYLTSLRMHCAADLIREGGKSLLEIADQIGYNDYFYFSKAFKKYYGISPSSFAKKHQNTAPEGDRE